MRYVTSVEKIGTPPITDRDETTKPGVPTLRTMNEKVGWAPPITGADMD